MLPRRYAERLDRIEQDVERASDHQELQAEVQAAFVSALGSDASLVVDASASRGGRIRLATDTGHIDVDVAEAGDAEAIDLRFHVAEAGLDRVATRDGVLESCDAEEHLVEALVARVASTTPKPASQTAGLSAERADRRPHRPRESERAVVMSATAMESPSRWLGEVTLFAASGRRGVVVGADAIASSTASGWWSRRLVWPSSSPV